MGKEVWLKINMLLDKLKYLFLKISWEITSEEMSKMDKSVT